MKYTNSSSELIRSATRINSRELRRRFSAYLLNKATNASLCDFCVLAVIFTVMGAFSKSASNTASSSSVSWMSTNLARYRPSISTLMQFSSFSCGMVLTTRHTVPYSNRLLASMSSDSESFCATTNTLLSNSFCASSTALTEGVRPTNKAICICGYTTTSRKANNGSVVNSCDSDDSGFVIKTSSCIYYVPLNNTTSN